MWSFQSDFASTSSSSTRSLSSPQPANRRVIFPNLHERSSSWPLLSDSQCSPEPLQIQAREEQKYDKQPKHGESESRCSSPSLSKFASTRRSLWPNQKTCTSESPTVGKGKFVSLNPNEGPIFLGPSTGEGQCQRLILPSPPLLQPKNPVGTRLTRAYSDPIAFRPPLRSILRSPKKYSPKNHLNQSSFRNDCLNFPPNSLAVDKIPSVQSDIPSLASTMSLSSEDDNSSPVTNTCSSSPANADRKIFQQPNLLKQFFPKPAPAHRSMSTSELEVQNHGCKSYKKVITFDPRVWVREFQRTPTEEESFAWYSNQELEDFKGEAIKLIMEFCETELIPTGTGRFVPRKVVPKTKAFFSHRALRMDI